MNPPIRHVQHIGPAGAALIHESESCRLKAYLDSGGLPTIGWGTTRYPDGRRVKLGDTCTQDEADAYFAHDLAGTERFIDDLTVDSLLLRQFEGLVSLGYNIGRGGFADSTVRRLVNENPQNPAIRAALMRWHFDNGQPVKGLWNRRHREADHYFGTWTPCPDFPYPKAA